MKKISPAIKSWKTTKVKDYKDRLNYSKVMQNDNKEMQMDHETKNNHKDMQKWLLCRRGSGLLLVFAQGPIVS